MALGLLLGRLVPGLDDALARSRSAGISLPIAIGPAGDDVPGAGQGPLRPARTRHRATARLLVASLLLNWVVGPALMFALAWLLLPDLPAVPHRPDHRRPGPLHRDGRSSGTTSPAATARPPPMLVALNAVFQIVAFAGLGWFYLRCCPAGWACRPTAPGRLGLGRSPSQRAGLPRHPAAGRLPDPHPRRAAPRAASGTRPGSCPRIGPVALYGLLFTIVMLFALQGDADHQPARWTSPASPCRCWPTSRSCGPGPSLSAARLGLGVRADHDAGVHRRRQQLRAGHRGRHRRPSASPRGQALAGVVGPLIEVPVLVGLVYVSPGAPPLRPAAPAATVRASEGPPVMTTPTERPVRLRPQRRPLPDGRRVAAPTYAGGRVQVRSAGSEPADAVNPAVVAVMAEVGLDISGRGARSCSPTDRRGRRRGDHHGLRRRLPRLPRQALRGLGRLPTPPARSRRGPRHPRRDRPAGPEAPRRPHLVRR